MAIFNTAAKLLSKPVPRFISPETHAIIDYITVGSFFMSAAWFWGRNKRAAIASLICGGANLCASLLTNYPGGVRSVISFRRHGEIDLGLAAMAASMPEFLAFEDDAEKKFFLAQGALMTAIHETTEFPEETSFRERVLEKTRAA